MQQGVDVGVVGARSQGERFGGISGHPSVLSRDEDRINAGTAWRAVIGV